MRGERRLGYDGQFYTRGGEMYVRDGEDRK